jgi:hypothetical protein
VQVQPNKSATFSYTVKDRHPICGFNGRRNDGPMKNSGFTMKNTYGPARLFPVTGVVLAVVVAFGSLGCSDKTPPPIKADIPLNSSPAATPSTTVLGVEPAGPTREAAATTSKAKTDVSKEQQSTAMPLPGQANDHSVLLPASSPQRPASR